MIDLCDIIKEARIKLGMNQSQFAKTLDITSPYIVMIENGQVNRISGRLVNKIKNIIPDIYFPEDCIYDPKNNCGKKPTYNEEYDAQTAIHALWLIIKEPSRMKLFNRRYSYTKNSKSLDRRYSDKFKNKKEMVTI